MERMWGSERQSVFQRGARFVQSARDTILDRAEVGAEQLARFVAQRSHAERGSSLTGMALGLLERRLWSRVASWVERVQSNLRGQRNRITPEGSSAVISFEAPLREHEPAGREREEPSAESLGEAEGQPETIGSTVESAIAEAEIVEARAEAPREEDAEAKTEPPHAKRARTAARAKPQRPAKQERQTLAAKQTANGATKAPRPAAKRAAAANRPSARREPPARAKADGAGTPSTTRWVKAPETSSEPSSNGSSHRKTSVDELCQLSAKDLLARVPELALDTCRELLDREKTGKNRKTIVAALSARLPS